MTVTPSIDPARLLEEQLAQASPDLLRELLTTFINTLMSAEADAVCGAAYGSQPGSDQPAQRLPGPRLRHPGRHPGPGGPQAPPGTYFPEWLLERRKRAERALTSVVATCYLLGVSTRRMDKLVQSPGHHHPVQVPGHRDGQGPRRARGGVPHPTARGRGPVHLRGRRRVGAQGPRGRPGRRRARPGRHRGQRRRAPGDPRRAGHHRRGRRRLARVLPRPGRPRPVRRQAGHLRCPRRPGRRDRRDPARSLLATVPHPLRGQPDVGDPEVAGVGSRRCCTASTTSPTPKPCTPSSTASSTP